MERKAEEDEAGDAGERRFALAPATSSGRRTTCRRRRAAARRGGASLRRRRRAPRRGRRAAGRAGATPAPSTGTGSAAPRRRAAPRPLGDRRHERVVHAGAGAVREHVERARVGRRVEQGRDGAAAGDLDRERLRPALNPRRAIRSAQRHFDAASLGVAAAAGDGFRLLQVDLVGGDAGRVQGVAHRRGARLGELLVLRRIAGRVGVAADDRALARGDALGDLGQRRLGAAREIGLAGGEVELDDAVLDLERRARRRSPRGAAVEAAGVAWVAPVLAVDIGSSGTISSATMLMILISGLTAGPAVSL